MLIVEIMFLFVIAIALAVLFLAYKFFQTVKENIESQHSVTNAVNSNNRKWREDVRSVLRIAYRDYPSSRSGIIFIKNQLLEER